MWVEGNLIFFETFKTLLSHAQNNLIQIWGVRQLRAEAGEMLEVSRPHYLDIACEGFVIKFKLGSLLQPQGLEMVPPLPLSAFDLNPVGWLKNVFRYIHEKFIREE